MGQMNSICKIVQFNILGGVFTSWTYSTMSDEMAMNGDGDETLFDKLLSVLNKPVNIK